jgi:predicted CXXCH cytochrome family protein
MKRMNRIVGVLCAVLIAVLIGGAAIEQGPGFWTTTAALKQMAGLVPAEAKEKEAGSPASSPYALDIKPLTTAECAQCHYSVFEAIKTAGARHQIDCVRCHREYHVYNPRKQNYDAIMPKCAWCHVSASGGAFHGENKSLTPCLNCHSDPHQPLIIPASEIETTCAICHAPVAQELKSHPSKHATDVTCGECHSGKHGYIPECSACHESHSPAVPMTSQECMICHPVHEPTQITYGKETDSKICAGCHETAYDLLQAKVTKHTAVACAECHPSHGEIPTCQRCHGEPHPKNMNATNCKDCHGIAHSLVM